MAMHSIVDYTQKLANTFSKQGTIADVESTSTSSKAYAVGDLFYYEGVLYKVTTAIAQGDSIVTSGSGQNVEVDTIGVDTTKLNRKVSALQKTGCVNLFECTIQSQVTSGVTVVKNSDGSVTISSESEITNNVNLILGTIKVKAGQRYAIKSFVSDDSTTTHRMWMYAPSAFPSGHRPGTDNYPNNAVQDALADDTATVAYNIYAGSPAITNPITIKPMVYYAEFGFDVDYAPRSMTNRELTERKMNLINLASSTFEYEGDGSYTYTGFSFTIPGGCAFGVQVGGNYYTKKPKGILLSISPTDILETNVQAASPVESSRCNLNGYIGADRTYYVWGKWEGNGTETVFVNGWYAKI